MQNLATANPILLFVEPPYGTYETMDWVAQAQLILALALALHRIEALRVVNVRTIFDIERFMARPESRPRLVQALNCARTDGKGRVVLLAERGITIENLESVVRAIGEDLHVQRLRQIWRNIELKLNLDLPQVTRARILLTAGRMPVRSPEAPLAAPLPTRVANDAEGREVDVVPAE